MSHLWVVKREWLIWWLNDKSQSTSSADTQNASKLVGLFSSTHKTCLHAPLHSPTAIPVDNVPLELVHIHVSRPYKYWACILTSSCKYSFYSILCQIRNGLVILLVLVLFALHKPLQDAASKLWKHWWLDYGLKSYTVDPQKIEYVHIYIRSILWKENYIYFIVHCPWPFQIKFYHFKSTKLQLITDY